MWWPLLGEIDPGRFQFELVPLDIQSLNVRAIEQGDLDITAISIHTYPHVKDRYALTSCGASMGDGYGPMLVAKEHYSKDDIASKKIAVPGEMTSAFRF